MQAKYEDDGILAEMGCVWSRTAGKCAGRIQAE